MENKGIKNHRTEVILVFFLIPLILPSVFDLMNIKTNIISYYLIQSVMLLSSYMLLPLLKENNVSIVIILIISLELYLFPFLIYQIDINVIFILITLILVSIIYYLIINFSIGKKLQYSNKNYLIFVWFSFIITSSSIYSLEIRQFIYYWSLIPVILISVLIGWYGKPFLFEKFKGDYSYAYVFALQLIIFLIIGFFYDIIIGDLLGLEGISLDGPSVVLLTIIYISILLISRICYEEYIKNHY